MITNSYDTLRFLVTNAPEAPAPPLAKFRDAPPIDNRGASVGAPSNGKGAANIGPPRSPPHRPPPTRPSSHPAEILLFTANAVDPEHRLQLEEEQRAILDALARARARDHYVPSISPAVTFAKVVHELDDREPAIVHFSGHGDSGGNIILASDDGEEAHISPAMIAKLFATLRHPPELVVFATCYSAKMAETAIGHVRHAIGFVDEVPDTSARKFSETLYERLAARPELDVPRAFELAQLATEASGDLGPNLVRLFGRPSSLIP